MSDPGSGPKIRGALKSQEEEETTVADLVLRLQVIARMRLTNHIDMPLRVRWCAHYDAL